MSDRDLNGAYDLDGSDDSRSHLWLQNLQATLADRLTEISPETWSEEDEPHGPRVLPLTSATGSSARKGVVERLKERKVVQWLLAYVAVGWMILQLNDALGEVWGVPLTLQRAGSLALGLGVLPALVVAWYHGEKGRQRVCCTEIGLVLLSLGVAVTAVWRVCFA